MTKRTSIIPSGPAPTGNEPSVAERYNRLKSAIRIADYLQAAGISSTMAQLANAHDRELAGQAVAQSNEDVEYRPPSEQTWREVVNLLVGRERAVDALRRKRDKAVAR